ncbi:MAG TPA: ferrous iron transport protein B [Verrucomicrobiota bacterium]|nr:ferrous iron transport protein B [Verrucomicrobiota bacterium]HNU51779.1 ferrous iron transport protein B [Verrucomicrobiota bacterium]
MASPAATPFRVVLAGNPNCGKTTVFNALTGLRAKVANYGGVTVERKEGAIEGARQGRPILLLDLPGTYSLTPQSPDEQIARDVLLRRSADVAAPDLVIVIADASNLERNLYFVTQAVELGYPTFLALNMIDVARAKGHRIDTVRLGIELGIPVFPLVASTGEGVPALKTAIEETADNPAPAPPAARTCSLPEILNHEVNRLAAQVAARRPDRKTLAPAEALLWLADDRNATPGEPASGPLWQTVRAARARLAAGGIDVARSSIERRYQRVADIHAAAVIASHPPAGMTLSDRLDHVVTHRIGGSLIFVAVMALLFHSIFTLAQGPMALIEQGVHAAGTGIATWLPPGDLQSLIVDGILAGVGAVVVFLPQICLLFLFLGVLEDTGYMARAAFLMDRVMSKVGLHGKSFIPLLGSFACAIPGIMATRTIETRRDRLVTILIAPLMSCSARLPVYTLLIAACIPQERVVGGLRLQGLTLLGMYLLGVAIALVSAWLFKKTLLRGRTPPLILELPPYRRPQLTRAVHHMWESAWSFLRQAGSVILGINILLWFLASYPHDQSLDAGHRERRLAAARELLPTTWDDRSSQDPAAVSAALARWQTAPAKPPDPPADRALRERLRALDQEHAAARLHQSWAGRFGRFLEPVLEPLGFDWRIGIGIVASFAAREVFVSTMAVVYSVGQSGGEDPDSQALVDVFRSQRRPDGSPVYTPLTGITLMVFYVVALQCVSTIVLVRRETGSWKWPLFQWSYLAILAWVLAFLTRSAGRALGLE